MEDWGHAPDDAPLWTVTSADISSQTCPHCQRYPLNILDNAFVGHLSICSPSSSSVLTVQKFVTVFLTYSATLWPSMHTAVFLLIEHDLFYLVLILKMKKHLGKKLCEQEKNSFHPADLNFGSTCVNYSHLIKFVKSFSHFWI